MILILTGCFVFLASCQSKMVEYIFTRPLSYQKDMIFLKLGRGLNQDFPCSETGCYSKAKKLSQPWYLSIACRRIVGFMPFPRALAQSINNLVYNLNITWTSSFTMMMTIMSRSPLLSKNLLEFHHHVMVNELWRNLIKHSNPEVINLL